MPRPVRKMSESGIYHVTQRGNAHGIIFEADDDRRAFLRILKKSRDELGFKVFAWCLMDNHFHLLLNVCNCDLSTIMRGVEASYVRYFNDRSERVGHLFQGPFYSGPVETDAQLIATVHYIHENPAAAGICSSREYRWSSIQEYLGKRYLSDTAFVIGVFGGIESMLAYQGSAHDVVYLSRGRRLRDAEAMERACAVLGVDELAQIGSCSRERRNQAILRLSNAGISARQIGRIVGLGNATVSRILSTTQ